MQYRFLMMGLICLSLGVRLRLQLVRASFLTPLGQILLIRLLNIFGMTQPQNNEPVSLKVYSWNYCEIILVVLFE